MCLSKHREGTVKCGIKDFKKWGGGSETGWKMGGGWENGEKGEGMEKDGLGVTEQPWGRKAQHRAHSQ